MTTTRTTTSPIDSATAPSRQDPIAPRGRRRPGVIAAGVFIGVLGAIGAAWMVGAAGDRTEVVVMARDVAFGAPLRAEDLTTTWAALDPSVSVVAAADLDAVVGRIAGAHLTTGAIVVPEQLLEAGPPGAGQALVPLPVTTDRLPAGGLVAGDRLLVVDSPTTAADPPEVEPAAFEVTVVRVGAADLNGVAVLDVVVEEGDARSLAARAATGRFALVLLAPGER